jgi:fumarate reductase subunit C
MITKGIYRILLIDFLLLPLLGMSVGIINILMFYGLACLGIGSSNYHKYVELLFLCTTQGFSFGLNDFICKLLNGFDRNRNGYPSIPHNCIFIFLILNVLMIFFALRMTDIYFPLIQKMIESFLK